MNDKTTGWIILIGSILGIIIYFYLIFLSPWSSLTIEPYWTMWPSRYSTSRMGP